ncbi:MAG TPA: FtsQ-type POTRA domain-containing protein [Opitutus sp.]|nr:FtsQ-type POTRA domain-containing protein [Opitutus sp.]
MSPEGRRRVVWSGMKTAFAVALVGGLAWSGFQIAALFRGDTPALAKAAEAVPVRAVELITDGVLDKDWLVRTLALPRNVTLMQLDLYQLQARLLQTKQVRSATLTRNFPSTLTVSLSEYSPVARVMAQLDREEPHVLLVSREGVVFEGVGFDGEMIATLPWLAGIKLVRRDDTFAPVAGMETVADLLAKAKLEAEHLYRDWQVVSLARLASDNEIEVQAVGVARIRFGTHEDFFRQLARLDSLLDAARAKTDKPLREVNLAIGAQVPVAFEDPTLVPEAMPANPKRNSRPVRPAATPSPFPQLQRNSNL